MADVSKNAAAASASVLTLIGGIQTNIAASDATATAKTVRLQTDSGGNLRTTQEGGKPTYSFSSAFSSDSTATDIAQIRGNATTTVKVKKIVLTSVATALAAGTLSIVRRSVANTSDTTAAAASAAWDNNTDGTPNSIPYHYTAAPSGLGTAVATAWQERIVQGATATVPPTRVVLDFEPANGGRGLVLRGTGDFLSVHVPAALGGSGNAFTIDWITTEEPSSA